MLTIDLSRSSRARLAALIVALNLVFTAGMAAFLYYWQLRDHYGPNGRAFIDRWLVQFHLGAENVVAAWYSSMLLLLVAMACLVTYALDSKEIGATSAKTGTVPVFRLRQGWLVLAAIFAALSLDEVGSLHERIGMVVALNRASLAPDSTQAVGWVYLLAIPIGAVALFMLAFGWMRLRRAPAAFALVAAGVMLYVSDPFLELVEQTLSPGSAAMLMERVLEEGMAELGGTTCVLFGVLLYAARTATSNVASFTIPSRWIRIATAVLLLAGIPLTHAVVLRLPAGDTGIPENWFPAAALFTLAIRWMAIRRAWGLAAIAIITSAYFGAGLFGYAGWYAAIGYPRVLLDMLATAAAVIVWIAPGANS